MENCEVYERMHVKINDRDYLVPVVSVSTVCLSRSFIQVIIAPVTIDINFCTTVAILRQSGVKDVFYLLFTRVGHSYLFYVTQTL